MVDTPTRPRPHVPLTASRRRWSWAWVVFSSVAIAGYFVGQYAQGSLNALADREVGLAGSYADKGWPIQLAFYVHIGFAGLALALGPWQFSRWLRARSRRTHRVIGRTYVVSVGLGAVAGLVMSSVSTVGISGFFGFGTLAVLWGWTAWRGYRAARNGDFQDHQAWMIRSFALTYAAVTLRLWLGVLIMVQLPFMADGGFDRVFEQAYAPLPYLCWIPNIVVAEFLIRRRGLPALHLVTSAPRSIHTPGVPAGAEPVIASRA